MILICPDCEEMTPALSFRGGVCRDCWEERQSELENFIAEFDEWNALTPQERENRIKEALQ